MNQAWFVNTPWDINLDSGKLDVSDTSRGVDIKLKKRLVFDLFHRHRQEQNTQLKKEQVLVRRGTHT